MKSKQERDQELFVLGAAAEAYVSLRSGAVDRGGPDPCADGEGNPYIDGLIATLELQPAQWADLVDIICEKRWKRAPEPYEYVKHAVRRRSGPRSVELVTLGSINCPTDWDGDPVDDSDLLTLLGSEDDAADERAFWAELDSKPLPKGIHRVSQALKITEQPAEWMRDFGITGPLVSVDWDEVARRAGIGEWGAAALQYKASGVSLYGALREQANDVDRKALRAAWARMERRLQSGEIKEILQEREFSTG